MARGKISLVGVEITGSKVPLSVGGVAVSCPSCGGTGDLTIEGANDGGCSLECRSCGYRGDLPAPEQQTSGSSE